MRDGIRHSDAVEVAEEALRTLAKLISTAFIQYKKHKTEIEYKELYRTEVVGASDYLPNTIWLRMFLEAQGYIIEESLYYQDNESAMKIELNGWRSTGSKSKHVDIRFYFIADRVKSERIEVHHCKTEHMVADFFTKPLQGALFRRLRDIVMGVVPIDEVFAYTKQERVVKNVSFDKTASKPDSQKKISALDKAPRRQLEQQPKKKMLLVKCNLSNQEHGAICQHSGASHQASCAIGIGSPHVNKTRARLFIKRIDDSPRMVALTRPRTLHRQNHELGLFANLNFSVWP